MNSGTVRNMKGLVNCRLKFTIRQRSNKNYNENVRVRFAPSPTGILHLGGLRTALYNYLFARANGGAFILRIEDTDQTRLVEGAQENLIQTLNWVGLTPNEGPGIGGNHGPYIQSERKNIYLEKVKTLLSNGSAYHCFCSESRLDLIRRDALRNRQIPKYDNKCRHLPRDVVEEKLQHGVPFAIRFKLQQLTEPFEDLVYGKISYNVANHEGDPVIIKSDGFPTYHFANVVDDHLMQITHVLRGVEWQTSTTKHILLYQAFGWKPPKFAHLPLIVKRDGSKLSKRDGDAHVEHLRMKGFFSEAVLNFVIHVGGGFGKDENKFYSMDEMIEQFSLEKVNVNSGRVDMTKLDQFNQVYIQKLLKTESGKKMLISKLKYIIANHYDTSVIGKNVLSDEYILQSLEWAKERIHRLEEMVSPKFNFLWSYVNSDKQKQTPLTQELKIAITNVIMEIPESDFVRDTIHRLLRNCANECNIPYSEMMGSLRIALCGQKEGPSVGELFEVLGKQEAMSRL